MSKLKNKIAIITGASKGIGASIAKHFAAEGAKVVVNYATSKEGADSVVKAITDNGGTAIAVQADQITIFLFATMQQTGKANAPCSAQKPTRYACFSYSRTYKSWHNFVSMNIL